MKRCVVLGCLIAFVLFTPVAQGRATACCVDGQVKAVYDPATKTVTVSLVVPDQWLQWSSVSTGPKLDPTGNALDPTAGAGPYYRVPNPNPPAPDYYGPSNGQVQIKVDFDTDFYVQVNYVCESSGGCGGNWGSNEGVHAKPVLVKVPAAAAKPAKVIAKTGEVPDDNGTAACRTARNNIKYLNQEIKKAVADLNAAFKLNNPSATQQARQKQLQKRVSDLEKQLAKAVPKAQTACKKK